MGTPSPSFSPPAFVLVPVLYLDQRPLLVIQYVMCNVWCIGMRKGSAASTFDIAKAGIRKS